MAGEFGSNDLFRSRILGMALEDTPQNPQASAGLGGATPEQIQAFFQSPQVQQQFGQFGIDPQAFLQHTRQSPFFPNSFMQSHPGLGQGLSQAMANVAATPEAPLVSGPGSGMSRAMQGMMGGNELLRHYQLQQMLAPMGALGSMMPAYGEQRRQAIEQQLVESERQRQELLAKQGPQIKGEIVTPPGAPGYFTPSQPHPLMIPGAGGQGMQASQVPGGLPMPGGAGSFAGSMGAMAPGGQPEYHPYDPQQVQAYYDARQHPQTVQQAGHDTSREKVAQTGAEAKKYSADKSAQSKVDVANIMAGNKLDITKLQNLAKQAKNEADLTKLQVQISANPNIDEQSKVEAQRVINQHLIQMRQSQGQQPAQINPGAQNTQPRGGGNAPRPGGTDNKSQAPTSAPSTPANTPQVPQQQQQYTNPY